jgi:hypothetical protein
MAGSGRGGMIHETQSLSDGPLILLGGFKARSETCQNLTENLPQPAFEPLFDAKPETYTWFSNGPLHLLHASIRIARRHHRNVNGAHASYEARATLMT